MSIVFDTYKYINKNFPNLIGYITEKKIRCQTEICDNVSITFNKIDKTIIITTFYIECNQENRYRCMATNNDNIKKSKWLNTYSSTGLLVEPREFDQISKFIKNAFECKESDFVDLIKTTVSDFF
jgi:hypothetical protein